MLFIFTERQTNKKNKVRLIGNLSYKHYLCYMKYNRKHIEEFLEVYSVALLSYVFLSNENQKNKCEKDERWVLIKRMSEYNYMEEQLNQLVNWAYNYLSDKVNNGCEITNVFFTEKEGRKNGTKDDFIIEYVKNNEKYLEPYSLKMYKSDGAIQSFSSTFPSFILSCAFDRDSLNKFLFDDNIFFTGRNHKKIQTFLIKKGYSDEFIKNFTFLKTMNVELFNIIKTFPNFFDMEIDGKRNTKESFDAWKQLCENTRNNAKEIMYLMIRDIYIKDGCKMIKRLLTSFGFIGKHKTLHITTDNVHVFDNQEIDCETVNFDFGMNKGGLYFTFSGNNFNYETNVPLTINRNGAYNLEENRESFKTEKCKVPYGHIRPVKSKQIATSTNSWTKIL